MMMCTYVLEENNVLIISFQVSDNLLVSDNDEDMVVDTAGNSKECLSFSRALVREETEGDDIVGSNEFLSLFSRGDFKSWGTSLLLQPVDNVISLTTT